MPRHGPHNPPRWTITGPDVTGHTSVYYYGTENRGRGYPSVEVLRLHGDKPGVEYRWTYRERTLHALRQAIRADGLTVTMEA